MWNVAASETDLIDGILFAPSVPPKEVKVGNTVVSWWEGKPGDAVVMASGGSPLDRWIGEQCVTGELEAVGYKRAYFTFDAEHKTAGWPDIMQKAKRLIQSGNVTMLRNGFNNIVAHVIGDHGEYNCEIGRDDPESRAITTWQCECPWDQYAWQRTRQWKKYEGRPCAHVLAAFWKSQATPLDEAPPPGQNVPPGQATMPPPGGGGGAPGKPAGPPLETPKELVAPQQTSFGPEEAMGTSAPMGAPPPMAPPGQSGVLPPSPMEQLQQMQPPIPGATPGGMPANPNVVSVPGAKMPTPFNPIQFPGGTYSKVAAEETEFSAPEIVRLKEEGYGVAEGKSDAHGNGQFQPIPMNSEGEVLYQDPTTGMVEVIFPLSGGPLTPYHVKMFCEPSQIEHTQKQPPGPFIKRR